jgi:dihydrodipicolinate synthase/N-acetylneuraminate lyase
MTDFFFAIADHSPAPLIPYNMPFRTSNNLEPETVERLACHPNIAGIKDTVSDMARTLDILVRVGGRDDFAYLHGNELLIAPSLLFGAKGAVPAVANFAPTVFVETFEAARARDVDRLKTLHARIQRLMRVWGLVESRPQESTTLRLKAIKLVLELAGICGSTMAQTDRRPTDAEVERVREFLREERLFAGAD